MTATSDIRHSSLLTPVSRNREHTRLLDLSAWAGDSVIGPT